MSRDTWPEGKASFEEDCGLVLFIYFIYERQSLPSTPQSLNIHSGLTEKWEWKPSLPPIPQGSVFLKLSPASEGLYWVEAVDINGTWHSDMRCGLPNPWLNGQNCSSCEKLKWIWGSARKKNGNDELDIRCFSFLFCFPNNLIFEFLYFFSPELLSTLKAILFEFDFFNY